MTEEKKTSKSQWRKYLVFALIIVVLILILKSIDWNLKTTDEKIAEYKEELQAIEESKENAVPQEYLNALNKAGIYCWMWFSKWRIFDQLTSTVEWFTEDSTNYAIENLECDYQANALKTAENYFKQMNMSKDWIKNQLTSNIEKFTEEEAQFAIDNLE
jgi:hypothetical protein